MLVFVMVANVYGLTKVHYLCSYYFNNCFSHRFLLVLNQINIPISFLSQHTHKVPFENKKKISSIAPI